MIFKIVLLLIGSFIGFATESHLRKLIGSNCVLIERGTIPPYYDCVGCVIEKAAACIDDMRHNRSYNVAAECRLFSVKEFKDISCCPKFGINGGGSIDLSYVGSAYPEALRCIKRVGCDASILYAQLKEECSATCRMPDPRNGGDTCLANFNGAVFTQASLFISIMSIMVVAVYNLYS